MEFNATFIVALISFVIFVIVMNWILYKPIGDIVDKRKKFIDENYSEAKNNSEKSECILQDRKEKLEKAHRAVQEDYIKAVNVAKNKKEDLIREANEKSAADIEEKTNIYQEESKQAEETLRNDIVNLAKIISNKFITTPEGDEIEQELIDKVMQE